MSSVSPVAHALARQVLSQSVGVGAEAAVLAEAFTRTDALLRGRLGDLIGLMGYTTLMARAVRLAQAENPALERMTVDFEGDGRLHGVREYVEMARASSADPHAAEAGLTAVLAQVIGLLITFIGEDLALRLVREAWPEFTHNSTMLEEQA